MARIIYAVCGEGFGHASRAHLIGQRFLDAGHEVIFAASQRALLYLKQYYGEQVREIFGLSYDYSRGRIAPFGTVKKNVTGLPRGKRLNRRLFNEVYKPFKPDLVVTDFEPFSAWWAWRHRVPFISINNEHALIFCKLEHETRNIVPRTTASVVTRFHYFGAKAYVVITFFQASVKGRKVVLAPPIVRPVVTQTEPSDDGHVTVYWTTGTREELLRGVLSRFGDQRFHIYGFNRREQWRNCTFKERSTEGFLADLASSRGVIASAGFSLISECLHLKKKMLLLPVAGQYEQFINAYYTEKLGLGVWSERLSGAVLSRFLERVDEPMPRDDRILWPDNEQFFQTLGDTLAGLPTRVQIRL